MRQAKRNSNLAIDLRIRVRGSVYLINVPWMLKWAGVLAVAGFRVYQICHGAVG